MDTATPIRRGKQFPLQSQSKVSLQTMTPPNSSTKILPNLSKRKYRKLPMIVDISVDINGNQVYQVHETKKLVRKEMPRSNFESAIVTPQKNIGLHQVSSSSLNKKRSRLNDDDDDNDERYPFPSKSRKFESNFKRTNTFSEKENQPNQDEVIWSLDVEALFLEALRIIPKNGLTKIKISGRTCGRNELISDFIMTKTGKQRTRKQVSSHIQVIKNMKKNKELIDLIKNGPSEPSLFKKFDEIFGKINFQKSIGATGAIVEISSNPTAPPTPTSVLQLKKQRRLKSFTSQQQQQQQQTPLPPPQQQQQKQQTSPSITKPKSELNFKIFKDDIPNMDFQFYMTDIKFKYVNTNEPNKSHVFTGLKTSDFFEAPLKIRENTNLTKRFPYLYDLVESKRDLPILHGMCNLALPNFKTNDLKGGFYDVNSECYMSNLKPSDQKLSCLTIVYSFGKQILQFCDALVFKTSKVDNNIKRVSLDLPMGPQFWRQFNQMLKNYHDQNYSNESYSNEEVDGDLSSDDTIEIDDAKDEEISSKQKLAIRGLTIKQIIVASDKYQPTTSINELNKDDIRSILLWEFNKVDTLLENSTTMRQVYLPNSSIVEEQEQEQLPTPKTSSFSTFQHHSELSPYSPEHQYPLIPAPPIQSSFTTHSSLPNLFVSDSDSYSTTNQFRSLSSSDIARHLLSPQNSEHDVEENGLMLQALNPDELYCEDPDVNHSHDTIGSMAHHSSAHQQQHLLTTIGKDDISNLFKNEDFFW